MALAALLGPIGAGAADQGATLHQMVTDFAAPSPEAKPLVFWQWMNGCVSREGITSDLESFKRVGLDGVQNFQVGGSEAALIDPSVPVLGPTWRAYMRFAEAECSRLGLSFGTHNCPGWSSSGGPWVTPAQSMQRLVWSKVLAIAPAKVPLSIPRPEVDPRWNYYEDVAVLALPAEGDVQPGQVMDLTSSLEPNGTLNWTVPPGKWEILRFGHTTTGKINGTAPPSGQGLECDKLSRQAVDAFWRGYPEKLLEDAGAEAGRAFRRLEIDSYEAGLQDWTPSMRDEFFRRRRYKLLPWLPVLAGRTIGSHEISERFIADWKRTISDLFADNYYDYMAELAHRVPGLELMIEPYATGVGEPFEGPEVSDGEDELACEFWSAPSTWGWDSVKPVTSSAHVDGKRLVYGEAFTGQPQYAWRADPFSLKATGDRAFCLGVNRLILHASPLQPWPRLKPGMTMGWWGTQFGPGQTWWEHGGPEWIRYLARCQGLLQMGRSVADLCYLAHGRVTPALPRGFDGDTCGHRELLTRIAVENGCVVSAGGTKYRLLVLPDSRAMLPDEARRLRELVRDGAVVVGPKPDHSPSLEDYPFCDAAVAAIGNEVWGEAGHAGGHEHSFGRGRVFWNEPLQDVLNRLDIEPDVSAPDGAPVLWIHRRTSAAEIYFISNQASGPAMVTLSFRVSGRRPELWWPDTGEREPANGWTVARGRTEVPLRLSPSGSVFVVFPTEATVQSQIPAGSRLAGSPSRVLAVPGPWEITFPPGWGAPARIHLDRLSSWSDNPNPGVRYFSGTAVYHACFQLGAELRQPGRRFRLDLGDVRNVAAVRLNGTPIGTLWKPPFELNVTAQLRIGLNRLEVEVTNLWPNRMIGDEQQPDDCVWGAIRVFRYVTPPTAIGRPLLEVPRWVREDKPRPSAGRYTFSTFKFFTKDSPLLPSGLLGPVTLRMWPEETSASAPSRLRVAIASDSTAATWNPPHPERGWGQFIARFFDEGVDFQNFAKPGASTKTFLSDGLWAKVLSSHPDFVLIQFGHNDSHTPDHPEHTDANTLYCELLRRFVKEARAAGARPILITPVKRRNPEDTLVPYVAAMKRVAAETNTPLIDLHQLSSDFYAQLGASAQKTLGATASDLTHFNAKGATLIAGLVADALADATPELRAHRSLGITTP